MYNTINKSNRFSLARFWALLVCRFMCSKEVVVSCECASITAVTMFAISAESLFCVRDCSLPYAMLINLRETFYPFLCLVLALSVSLSAISLSSTHGRVTELALPATAGEKFWSRILAVVLSGAAVFVGIYLLGFGITAAICLAGDAAGSYAGSDFSMFNFGSMRFWQYATGGVNVASNVVTVLYLLSVYMLGGVLLKRLGWIGASLVLLALLVALGLLHSISHVAYVYLSRFAIVPLTVLTVVNVWLSYWFFSRMQAARFSLKINSKAL